MFLAGSEVKSGTGRLRVRWMDVVDQDSKRIGERNWRRQARNRDEWR
jgi:hypothetical protein